MKKLFVVILINIFLWPLVSQAVVLKNSYPRLANYFLKWEISDSEATKLAKWDVLVLDMEVQENSRDQISKIRKLNPRIIILAYITSQEIINDIDYYNKAYLRQDFSSGLIDAWWLRDALGNKISNWPETSMLNLSNETQANNLGQRFNDYLPNFVAKKLASTGLWDGVFYDNVWGDVSWIKNNIDINNDGYAESAAVADNLWIIGYQHMLAETKKLVGPNFIIIGNGKVYNGYQSFLNGMMLEAFPSPWENGGTWTGSMTTYLKLPSLNVDPNISVVNIYDKNQANYRHMRYGLTSTLLGEGFYSYDYDVTSHGQTWWYDEYNINLGMSQSGPYNLLNNASTNLQPGLWRRDFKNGVVIVNSTNKKQTYIFAHEELDKIKGSQDKLINNGQKINYLILEPQDGIVLWKRSDLVLNNPFINGYFYRVYNISGQQERNGFFSYIGSYPGAAQIVAAANSQGEAVATLSANEGRIDVYKNNKKITTLVPYGYLYKKSLSLAALIHDGYFQKIITGAGQGGGPQVSVYNKENKLEYRFFAYEKNLRGGVNVAIGDLNGDGQIKIVTAPGPGSEPLIKVFSLSGKLESSFLAYGANFYGGVNISIGDVNGDGRKEIVSGPASNGGPQIRIFSSAGKLIGSFFSYDKNFRGGVSVTMSDINNDGREEILAGLKNFY